MCNYMSAHGLTCGAVCERGMRTHHLDAPSDEVVHVCWGNLFLVIYFTFTASVFGPKRT